MVQDVSSMYRTLNNDKTPSPRHKKKRLGSSVGGASSRAVARDVAFRAAGVASALLGLGAVTADVAL
jgi:hypothetical protein